MAHHLSHLAAGRRLGLSAAGDPSSRRIVVFFHPMPAAGGFDPDPPITERAGMHLLMYDRPGYGASDPLPADQVPSVQAHADDIAELIRRDERDAASSANVRYGSIGVVGWGSGGRYALSFAARHPDLVDEVVVVGTPSPRSDGPQTGAEYRDRLPGVRGRAVVDLAGELSSGPKPTLSTLGVSDSDPELQRNAGLDRRLDRMLQESTVQGWEGIASDLIAASDDDWAAQLPDITAKVLLVYGDRDPLADAGDAKWFSHRIPHAKRRVVSGGTHLVLASNWQAIMRQVTPDDGRVPDRLRDRQPLPR